MVSKTSIKLDTSNGKIKVYNNRVYLKIKSEWDEKKKHSIKDRVCIGLIDTSDRTKFFPNNSYYEIFNKGKVELKEPGDIDDYLHIGSYLALKEAGEKCGAIKALKKIFPDTWEQILAFCIYIIDSRNSRSQGYEKWGFSNYSGLDFVLSSQGVSKLFASISNTNIRDFLREFKKTYKESNISKIKLVLAFDSTNINTHSKNIELAEFGHPKKKEKLPIISTAMGVDEVTGIPLFYEDIIGSLLDKTQLEETSKKLKDLGYKNCFFIFDRGYYKSDCLDAISSFSSFAIMVPDSVTTSFDYIKNNGFKIKDNENYFIKEENAYGISGTSASFLSKETNTYIYFDPDAQVLEKDTIHSKILHSEEALSDSAYSQKVADANDDYLITTKTKENKFAFKENLAAIQRDIDFAGFFMAISNKKLKAGEMLQRLRKRDRAEKAFRNMKSQLDSEKSYCHGLATYTGRNFVIFFSLVLFLSFRYLERSMFKTDESSTNDTTATVLGKISKLIAYKNTHGTWNQKYALTSSMKEILSNLDLTQTNISSFITKDLHQKF